MLKLQEIKSAELKNINIFYGRAPRPPQGDNSPLFLFCLKSLFVVSPSTEKSLIKALCYRLYRSKVLQCSLLTADPVVVDKVVHLLNLEICHIKQH